MRRLLVRQSRGGEHRIELISGVVRKIRLMEAHGERFKQAIPTGAVTHLQGKARVEQQKRRVANLEAATLKSKALLRELEDTLLLIIGHRDALIQEAAKDSASSDPPPLPVRSAHP